MLTTNTYITTKNEKIRNTT